MYKDQNYCVLFPEGDDVNLQSLKSKCDSLGIGHKKNDTRKILHYLPSNEEQINSISEKDLKRWVNQYGTSIFAENEDSLEYKNWERLLFSGDPDNVILAILLLNTKYRPEPKFFSLWFVLGLLHEDENVKEAGEMMVLQYIEKEKWDRMKWDGTLYLGDYLDNKDSVFNSYYDLNYLNLWKRLLAKDFNETVMQVSSKNVDLICNHEQFTSLFSEVNHIGMRLENGDSLEHLIFLLDNCPNVNSIKVFSDEAYQLNIEELAYFNRTFLLAKNFEFPSMKENLPLLDKVTHLEWIYSNEIYYSDIVFPNIVKLNLLGTKVQTMDISRSHSGITEMELCFTEQRTLPDCVYSCENLETLHMHECRIDSISSKMSQLIQLKNLCLRGTAFTEYPIEFMLAPKLEFIYHLPPQSNGEYRFDKYEELNQLSRIDWSKDTITDFPYEFSKLRNLKSMTFVSSTISEIDDRIADFDSLEKLFFGESQFENVPSNLLRLPNIKGLGLNNSKISNISFELIKLINEKGISLGLRNTPINRLPDISMDFIRVGITKNNGKLIFTPGSLPSSTVLKYKDVFGEEFIVA